MKPAVHDQSRLDPATAEFYRQALDLLLHARLEFMVGGAYALARYTGIERHTKDLDVFLRRADCPRALNTLARHGNRSEATFPHWLAKAYQDGNYVDFIYSSGNGIVEVDDVWFEHAVAGTVLERPVLLCPCEEMIWSKLFIMERERYDGADIAHLLRACGPMLDWNRLLRRVGPHWRLLLTQLVLFGYIYPAERDRIPEGLMRELLHRLRREEATPPEPDPVCCGTMLSRAEYLVDIHEWGYKDARLPPYGRMKPEEIAHWTACIGIENPSLEE
jgi:hypothetical protein